MGEVFEVKNRGITNNEAWQRLQEFGKNTVCLKNKKLERKYNYLFNRKTKVIREGKFKRLDTKLIVPGDFIIISKGNFIPGDGKVIEEKDLYIEDDSFIKKKDEEIDKKKSIDEVFAGTMVKNGSALVEVSRTGADTLFGNSLIRADSVENKESRFLLKLHRIVNMIGVLGILFLLFGFLFTFTANEGNTFNVLSLSAYTGLLLFASTIPFGLAFWAIIKFLEQRRIIKGSGIVIKNAYALPVADDITTICVDDRYLAKDYTKCIQRLYQTGVRVVVISKKNSEDAKKIAKEAGVFLGDAKVITGKEFDLLTGDEIINKVQDVFIFSEMGHTQKEKLVDIFRKLNISTIVVGDNLEDVATVEYADIGLSANDNKREFDNLISNGVILKNDFAAIYSLIKGGVIFRKYIRNYFKFSLLFQMPVIILILASSLGGIIIKEFAFQILLLVFGIIPTIMVLVDRDYSEKIIFEVKDRSSEYGISCVKCVLEAVIITLLVFIEYYALSLFSFSEFEKVNIITISIVLIYTTIVFVFRGSENEDKEQDKDKIKLTENKEKVKEKKDIHDKKSEEKHKETKSEKPTKVHEEKKTEKKSSSKNKKEDLRDNII